VLGVALSVGMRRGATTRRYQSERPPDRTVARRRVTRKISATGLKGVRDSTAHVEERVRGEAHGKKIATQPITNSMVHAPGGGVMIISALNNQHYGGTIADGTYADVEVADATTEVARRSSSRLRAELPFVFLPAGRHVEREVAVDGGEIERLVVLRLQVALDERLGVDRELPVSPRPQQNQDRQAECNEASDRDPCVTSAGGRYGKSCGGLLARVAAPLVGRMVWALIVSSSSIRKRLPLRYSPTLSPAFSMRLQASSSPQT
jgi:hypothetical protein